MRGHRRVGSVLLVVLCALFAFAPAAHAGTVTFWSTIQPTGTVGASVPVVVQGSSGYDAYPLDPGSVRLLIDGFEVPRSSYTASISRTGVYLYYVVKPVLADGAHTFLFEIRDTSSRLSAKEWSATR